VPRRLRLPLGGAPAPDPGLRVLRPRRPDGVRSAALARRAGLGTMAPADALDRAPEHGAQRLSQGPPPAERARRIGQRSCSASQRPLATMTTMPSADQWSGNWPKIRYPYDVAQIICR